MRRRRETSPKERVRWAVGRYAVAWLLTSVIVAAALAMLLGREEASRGTLDPQRARLVGAAQEAGCVLRTDAGGAPAAMVDVSKPPTFGPAAPPAEDGVYSDRLPVERIVGALRRGTVIVQYRGSVDERVRLALRLVAEGVPGVIVAPDGTGMPYRVAATAWRRVLGCPSLDTDAIVALRAFRDRYRGALGPESPR